MGQNALTVGTEQDTRQHNKGQDKTEKTEPHGPEHIMDLNRSIAWIQPVH